MNSRLVYILFVMGRDNDPIGVYDSRHYAESDARILNLKDWYILNREFKG